MSVEILVSTMNCKLNLMNKMNVNSDCTIINQCGKNEYIKYKHKGNSIKYISSDEIGLSKSRNLALNNSKEDILVLADDDLEYIDNYKYIIEKYHSENPYYDILVFQVNGKNKSFKEYSCKEKKVNFLSSMKVSSVEITLKRNSIVSHNIKFNELFGAGSKYKMGEENIFLFECLKNGLKIKYIPVKIADLYIGESSWFNGFNEKYFFDRGAIFAAMSKSFCMLFILQFAIRHYNKYREKIKFTKSINLMIKGKNDYLKSIKV